jgi:hypothetical protein
MINDTANEWTKLDSDRLDHVANMVAPFAEQFEAPWSAGFRPSRSSGNDGAFREGAFRPTTLP